MELLRERLIDHDLRLLNTFAPLCDLFYMSDYRIKTAEKDNGECLGDIKECFPEMRERLAKFNPLMLCEFEKKVGEGWITNWDHEKSICLGTERIYVEQGLSKTDTMLTIAHELGHAVSPFAGDTYNEIASICSEKKMRIEMGLGDNNYYDSKTRTHFINYSKYCLYNEPIFVDRFLDKTWNIPDYIPYVWGSFFSVLLPENELDKMYDKPGWLLRSIARQIMLKPKDAIKKMEEYLFD